MIISRQKEVMALTILDQIGESNMQSSIKGADNSGSITECGSDVQSQDNYTKPRVKQALMLSLSISRHEIHPVSKGRRSLN